MPGDLRIETPRSLTEMIVERLERAICDGEFALGEMISEETLARSFGVSRTPVRDALSILQQSGLVVIRNKKGSFVFQPSLEDATALCEYRLFLEGEGIRLSHARARAATLARLKETAAEMIAARETDAVAYGRADSRFHQAFLEFAGNPYLADAYRLAAGRVAALRTHLTARALDRRRTSFDEHEAMIALYEAGELDRMVALLTVHIDRTRTVYTEALAAEPAPLRRFDLR